MNKYNKLSEYFSNCYDKVIKLTFDEIENICGEKLDHSFLNYKKNLSKIGYKVSKISQNEKLVIFENIGEIVLVDENDNQIGFGEKMNIHKKGLLHRAISVLIFNSKGELLLQQRALGKYHCPGLWSNTTCTHPYPNETNIEAAHRRLQEEMGFDCDINEIFSFKYTAHFDNGLIENEFDHVFKGIYDGDIKINPDEANDYKRINIDFLKKDISQYPNLYTAWFKIILEKYLSL